MKTLTERNAEEALEYIRVKTSLEGKALPKWIESNNIDIELECQKLEKDRKYGKVIISNVLKSIQNFPTCEQCGKSFNPNGEENLEICFECE
jgi:hypothetical protein